LQPGSRLLQTGDVAEVVLDNASYATVVHA
jgi:hypothetical protein